LREQPALSQEVAERTGHCLESLPLVRLLRRDDVVEDQVAIVVVAIGEPEFRLVLLQTFLGRQAGHVLCPLRARIASGGALDLNMITDRPSGRKQMAPGTAEGYAMGREEPIGNRP